MKISILLPIYNGIEFLDDCITSIIEQSHTDWELLIGVNGRGQKKSNYIRRKIEKYKDNRIKCFILKDRGKSNALNFLKEQSCGESNHIALIDIDDKWHQHKLQQQSLLADKFDVIGTNTKYFGDSDGDPHLFLGRLFPNIFRWQNPIINSSVVMKKSLAYWNPEFEKLDDYNLWINLLNDGASFYNTPEVLTYHRIHEKSYFNKTNDEEAKKLFGTKIEKLSEEEGVEINILYMNKSWDL